MKNSFEEWIELTIYLPATGFIASLYRYVETTTEGVESWQDGYVKYESNSYRNLDHWDKGTSMGMVCSYMKLWRLGIYPLSNCSLYIVPSND